MRHPAAVATLLSLALCAALPLAAQQQPMEEVAITSSASQGPLPIGVEQDVYCTGWLGQRDEPMTATILSAEAMDVQTLFSQGDIVYIDIGTSRGCLPGQEYWIVRPGKLVYEDATERDLVGRVYQTPGRLRVICAQEESAVAEITSSCTDIVLGDYILPFEPIPIPLVRRTRPLTSCDPAAGKVAGHIVEVKDYATPIAEQSVVYIDLGEAQGLAPGDFLSVYRVRPGGVRTMLGELSILTTRSRTATAIVTLMHDNMGVGDLLEPK